VKDIFPQHMLFNVEFHPQCVRKSPIDGCARTCSWRHQLTSNPLSLVSSKNCSGKFAEPPNTTFDLTIHKNGCLLFASPHANSFKCCSVITVTLPKFMYTIELGSHLSSHWRHLESSFHKLKLKDLYWLSGTCRPSKGSGPIL
jgi:hypothetical protein